MNNDLLRQRRNLLVISIALLLFEFAGVRLEKISILGNEVAVGDVIALHAFVWVMWAYFLLRYYQYWNAERGTGIRPDIHSSLYGKVLQYALKETGRNSPIGIEISNIGTRWSYSVEHGTAASLPSMLSRWWTLQAYLATAVHTPKVTDHFLPFALAIATPLVIVVRMIW
jgi:hypothetical protein